MILRTGFLSVVMAASLCSPLAAQEAPDNAPEQQSPTILPGSHLRIFAASLGTRAVEGTAAGFEDGLLVLDVGSGKPPLRIDLGDVSRVELRTKQSTRGKGAGYGAAAGAVGFLLLVVATDGCDGSDFEIISDELCYGSALVFGGGVGALVGLAVAHGERWEPVPLDEAPGRTKFKGPGLRWEVAVRDRGMGLSLSVGF